MTSCNDCIKLLKLFKLLKKRVDWVVWVVGANYLEKMKVFYLSPAHAAARLVTLLLDRRSIDLSGAREKEGNFHYKNFLRASK